MALPERPASDNPPSRNPYTELAEVERRLERANEIETPLIRHFRREELLEQQDELQAEIDEAASPPEEL